MYEGNLCSSSMNVSVVRWKDKKDVFALLSFHGSSIHNEVPHKPEKISTYNSFINGVDCNDQLLSYYALNRKSLKWWKKVYWILFELIIVNMFQIMKFKVPSTSHKHLHLDLAQLLGQPLIDRQTIVSPGPGRASVDYNRLKGKYFGTGSKKGNKRGMCKVCGNQKTADGKRKDTKTANFCTWCKVFLYEGDCF